MRRFERNGQNESETCCDGPDERGDALLALRQMLAGFQLCGHYAIPPRNAMSAPPLAPCPTLLAQTPDTLRCGEYTLCAGRVYSPDWKSILSTRKVYTLSGTKCILFCVLRVYTFTRGEYTLLRKSVGGCARKCRGLHPRVSGDASRSVGRIAKNVNFPLAFGGGIWDNTRRFT